MLRRLGAGETELRAEAQRALLRAGQPVELAWVGSNVEAFGPGRDRRHIQELLGSVDVGKLGRFFPSGPRRRLPLGTFSLLRPLVPRASKGHWLVARGPERRGDPQVIRVGVADMDGSRERHRWDGAPWLWHLEEPATLERLWGVSGITATRLDELPAPEDLERACRDGSATPTQRAHLSVILQARGDSTAALGLHGIELGQDVEHLLSDGTRGRLNDYWASHPPPSEAVAAVKDALRVCAPWRLEGLLQEVEAQVPSARRPLQLLYLAAGHRHSRRPRLALRCGAERGGRATLEIEHTASNRRVPDCRWRRPLLAGEPALASKTLGEWPFDLRAP
ncbi:MAG: hypothetical protein AB7N76_33475 [Planctomycetota bacterium]